MVTQVKTWLKLGQHLLRAAMVATSLPALAVGGAASGPLDLNTADAAALAQALQGVGPAKAQAIVEYRRQHGPFKSVDELALVKGIGPRTLERNRDRLMVRLAPKTTAVKATGPKTTTSKATTPKTPSAKSSSTRAPAVSPRNP